MKKQWIMIVCLFSFMLFNILLESAKHAAQAEYLAEKTASRFQVDKYQAWDFFSDVLPAAPLIGLVIESTPYLIMIVLYMCLERNDLVKN